MAHDDLGLRLCAPRRVGEGLVELAQEVEVNGDTDLFHPGQNPHERQLNMVQQGSAPTTGDLNLEHGCEVKHGTSTQAERRG
ncbi:unannotated protein [freshwater metagenome]|uniref:Unannotated protein n=1 Tax=freshwater metagenome TaxID=449393 RepID=A0A6J7QPV9_9ZZZZ